MNVDEDLIKHVAEVARLELSEEEVKKFLPQLQEVLNAFSKLQEVDTENVEPSFHPVKMTNALREDVPGECLTQEEALSCTKLKKDGYFKGPRAM